ncbi:helix-turn-helix domain-containing protein [Clostridioides difficile]|nr:helix-turn-helix domain-containing protein [Clostridioides difficile]EGT5014212.1 helix-turn-helix domain-containing protein [Clostridioides difficile]
MVLKETEVKELEKNYKLPMPTYCLSEKNYCAKEFGALMLISKGSMRIMHIEKNRYLYQNKFKMEELAKQIGVARTTLERNIKKLNSLDCKVLEIENSRNGIIYRLNYGTSTGYNDNVHKFVTIHHDMLQELISAFNTNAIKVYCLLCYMTTENSFKCMTEKFICEKIGLCGDSENNRSKIRKIITVFEVSKYIEVKKENKFEWDEEKNKKVPRIQKLYRLCSFSEWKNARKK